jgi:hypothetical protein
VGIALTFFFFFVTIRPKKIQKMEKINVIDSRRRPVSKDYVNIYFCVLKKIFFYFKLIFFYVFRLF